MKALRSPTIRAGFLTVVIVLAAVLVISRFNELVIQQDHALINAKESPEKVSNSLPTGSSSDSSESASSHISVASAFRWDLLERLMNSTEADALHVTKDDAEWFLQERGTTVFNLLAAASATGDEEFVQRTVELFPNHPAVQFMVLLRNEDLTPESRAEWITRFKASSPDNPLPFLYAARAAFERNDPATALAEASLAVEKPGLYFWNSETINARRNLFETAGYNPLEAELIATLGLSMPQWLDFQRLGGELLKLREQALKDSNANIAEESLRVVYGLGKMFQSPEGSRMLIYQVVGIGLEALALNAVPQEVQPFFLDVPKTQRKAEMMRLKDEIQAMVSDAMIPMQRRDAKLLAEYLRRFREEGEFQALRWLRGVK